jgi:hypothetical protein
VAFRAAPDRHWRSDGSDPLPAAVEAMQQKFSAFPAWFLRVEWERCGKVVVINEAKAIRWRSRTLADILQRMRHDGCGGLPGKAELLTGIEGFSSRPVCKILLRMG